MSTITRFLVVAVTTFLVVTSVSLAQKKPLHKSGTTMTRKVSQKVVYYCPMHPKEISLNPGKYPVCRMDLVKKKINQSPTRKERST